MRGPVDKSLWTRLRFFVSYRWSFNRLKKIGAIYRRGGVYICSNRMSSVELAVGLLAAAIIIVGFIVRDIIFEPEVGIPVLFLFAAGAVALVLNYILVRDDPGSIRLERGYLLIDTKNEKIRHDINNVVVSYALISARPPYVRLYIESKQGELLNELNARRQNRNDLIALVHLINYLKHYELSRLESLTKDEFLNIYRMSREHPRVRGLFRNFWR